MKHNRYNTSRAFLTVLALCAILATTRNAGAAERQPVALAAGDAELAVVLGANPSPAEKRVKE